MTRQAHILVILTSAALLGGAFAAQYGFGLYPCEMCMWQRWPHVAVLAFGMFALLMQDRARTALIWLAMLGLVIAGGLGVFHAGVEYGWWTGPTACSTVPLAGGGDFMTDILAVPIVRCDTAPWSLFGISLAGYNGLISLFSAGVAAWLMKRP